MLPVTELFYLQKGTKLKPNLIEFPFGGGYN